MKRQKRVSISILSIYKKNIYIYINIYKNMSDSQTDRRPGLMKGEWEQGS